MSSILAIAFDSRGFGFVVLDPARRVIDRGVKNARGGTDAILIAKVLEIVDAHCPHALILEDWSDLSVRRTRRSKPTLGEFNRAAHSRGIKVQCFTRSHVRDALAEFGSTSNQELIHAVATLVPDLRPLIPRPRKPWQSQPYTMPIFRAGALAISYELSRN